MKKACPAELTRYAMCLEKSDYKLKFSHCRETGEAYNACMKEKMGMETPHFGYHALVKVHQSDRCVVCESTYLHRWVLVVVHLSFLSEQSSTKEQVMGCVNSPTSV